MKRQILFSLAGLCCLTQAKAETLFHRPVKITLGVEGAYKGSSTTTDEGAFFIKGPLQGVNGDLSYCWQQGLSVTASLRTLMGGSRYFDNIEPTMTSSATEYLIEPKLVVNYQFPANLMTWIQPYIGIGYRYNRARFNYIPEESSRSTFSTGYTYIPIGGTISLKFASCWKTTLGLEYDLLLKATHRFTTITEPSRSGSVKSGMGAKIFLGLEREMGKGHSLRVEPFFQYWKTKKVDITDSEGIVDQWPKARSYEAGLSVKYQL